MVAVAADMMTAKPSLTIKRRLKASVERVYAAWTDPAMMASWFGPNDTKVASAETDVRVGGRFRVIMHALDGEVHDVSGIYRTVEPNRKLVFSWAWITTPERESLVTVTMKPDGEGTLLTLLHEQFADEAARDGHRVGWGEALDRLEAALA
jgi:uncharacterized protein YndB with AHSA1/START domain